MKNHKYMFVLQGKSLENKYIEEVACKQDCLVYRLIEKSDTKLLRVYDNSSDIRLVFVNIQPDVSFRNYFHIVGSYKKPALSSVCALLKVKMSVRMQFVADYTYSGTSVFPLVNSPEAMLLSFDEVQVLKESILQEERDLLGISSAEQQILDWQKTG